MAGHWRGDFFDAIAIEDDPVDDPILVAVDEEEVEEDEDEDEEDEDEDEDEHQVEEDREDAEPESRRPWANPPPRVSASDDAVDYSNAKTVEQLNSLRNVEGDGVLSSQKEVEGLCCPICMEPWCSSGDHQPSCLTCGHLFGMSCIKKWLGERRNSGKCPQCNQKCMLKDVRRIYGSQVVVVDDESQKRIRYLEAKCASLEKKEVEWRTKEAEWRIKVQDWQKREADLCQQLEQLTQRTSNLERTLGDLESKSLGSSAAADGFKGQFGRGHKGGISGSPTPSFIFTFQQELLLDGARHFDVDDSGQVLVVARRPTRIGGSHILTKMSLFSPKEQDNLQLPSTIKAVRDLHVSPLGRLVLLASMGKKLSLVSLESNNVVVDYDLPAAAWSCSWDVNSSHFVYAGLQNGMVLVFDLRQTMRALELRNGLTCNPVHTICSLSDDMTVQSGGVKRLLTASSVGLCHWNISDAHELPILITDTVNQGVCISLAYCSSSDNVVATFRPKVEVSDETGISQITQPPCSNLGQYVQGAHVLVKRLGSVYQKLGSVSATVPGIRLPKSTILELESNDQVFACGDEATSNLVLQKLPSLTVTQCLQSYHPIRDIKYTASQNPGLLCCLSEDRMQFFSRKFFWER